MKFAEGCACSRHSDHGRRTQRWRRLLIDQRPMKRLLSALLFSAALVLAGCAQYASVSEKRPRFHPLRTTVGALIEAQQGIVDPMKHGMKPPLPALGELLTSAQEAAQELKRDPKDASALEAYNFA